MTLLRSMTAFSPRYQISSVVLRQYEKQVVALPSYLPQIVVAMLVICLDLSSASPPSFLRVLASAPCVSCLFRFKMPYSNIPTLLEYFIPHLPSMSYNSMYHAGAFLFLITWLVGVVCIFSVFLFI